MKELSFVKMSGAGNDFIVVDNRFGRIRNPAELAKKLCTRRRSIGADGLLLLERSKQADCAMRIFNSDGSEADMCGNGVRCLASFASKKIGRKNLSVETKAGRIQAWVRPTCVKAKLSEPKTLLLFLNLKAVGRSFEVHYVNTGVPHAVVFVKDLERCDVETWGKAIRHHAAFGPKGANVNFVEPKGSLIGVRTFERGVEGETLACGTGSTASALITACVHDRKSPITVRTHGGERLKIYFTRASEGLFKDVCLEGPVKEVFQGRIKS